MKLKNLWKKYDIYILAFVIPWVIVVIHSLIHNSWLTGGGSISNGDTAEQLYPLFVELWEKVHSGESLFYSWNAGNGYDFYLSFAYYLISPFNIIVLFFPKAWIEIMLQIITILKWSGISISIIYFFMHTKYNKVQECKKLVSFTLGMAFSLSNCMVIDLIYINWLDVILIFPILLLLVEKMIDDGSWKLYSCLLFVMMLCNFYMAYQVCIFLVFWFFLQLDSNTKEKKKRFLVFSGSSVLAAVCSAVVIVPSILGVSNRYADNIADANRDYIERIINNFFDIVQKLAVFDDISDVAGVHPNIYFSIGCVVLACLYFIIKIARKEKWKHLFVTLFLFLGLCFGALSYAWHGFSVPNGIYGRFLYIVIFMCLLLALNVLSHFEQIHVIPVVILMIVEMAAAVSTFFSVEEYLEFYVYLFTILLFVFYQILLVLYCRKSITPKQLLIVFCSVVLLELGANVVYEFGDRHDAPLFADAYMNSDSLGLVEQVDVSDGERVNMQQCTYDCGMIANLPSSNMFLSYSDAGTIAFYERLGLGYQNNAICYLSGASPLLNLMFNVRYGTSNSATSFSDVEEIDKKNDVTLYRMQRLAGLGYMVSSEVEEWNLETLKAFSNQNQFVSLAAGEDDIFDVVFIEPVCTSYLGEIMPGKKYIDEGIYAYNSDNTLPHTYEGISVEASVKEDMDLYVQINYGAGGISAVYIDGERVFLSEINRMQETVHIGNVTKGQKINIYVSHIESDLEQNTTWFQFAKFNEDNYAKAYEKLSGCVYQIDEMSSAYIRGHIEAKQDGIMMTSIQDMDGFTVYVDGEKCDYKVIGGAWIGVPLQAGEHQIEFRYRTPYFVLGALVSMAGIVIFIAICIYSKHHSRLENIVMKEQEL